MFLAFLKHWGHLLVATWPIKVKKSSQKSAEITIFYDFWLILTKVTIFCTFWQLFSTLMAHTVPGDAPSILEMPKTCSEYLNYPRSSQVWAIEQSISLERCKWKFQIHGKKYWGGGGSKKNTQFYNFFKSTIKATVCKKQFTGFYGGGLLLLVRKHLLMKNSKYMWKKKLFLNFLTFKHLLYVFGEYPKTW